jgi:two-component system nitrogen regulation response regulator GlnG
MLRGAMPVPVAPEPDGSTAIPPPRTQAGAAARLVPSLTIVSHPDPGRVGERCLLTALLAGREIALSRTSPDFTPPGSALGTPLRDPFVSRRPIRFLPGDRGAVRLVADADGTDVALAEGPVRGEVRFGPAALAAGVPLVLADRVVVVLHLVDLDIDDAGDALEMVGGSTGVGRVRRAIRRLADLTVPVLLRGETGTGKERVAQALHDHSPRREGAFVSVNLGALPRDLAAAELFGATRGAYTGATRDRDGLFAAARGGTLFLDEVGEASPEVQAILLRVLETGEMYPIGSPRPVATDVRLIAATDADLEAHIRAGRFKAPLLHRLAGYEICLPPLRERREDIGLLFHHFAREAHRLSLSDPHGEPWLPAALALCLVRYSWPGNVRQLRNIARQLVIYSRGQAQLQIDPRLATLLDAGASPTPAEVERLPVHAVERPLAAAAEPPVTAGAERSMTEAAGRPAAVVAGRPVVASAERSPAAAVQRPVAAGSRPPQAPDREVRLDPRARRRPSEVTEAELLAALREAAWDLKAAGDRLGVPRSSMYDLIERCPGVRTVGDVSAEEIVRCFDACDGDLDRMADRLQVSRRGLRRRVSELGLANNRPAR